MKRVIVICFLIMAYMKVSRSLRMMSMKVPEHKQHGDSATMICIYVLSSENLYSVKWYKDNEEFYRYMPKLKPPQRAHSIDGVIVDLAKSNARRVHLKNLTIKSRGQYRCEVSEEGPSFLSGQAEAYMEVYYFPRDSPLITGQDRRYRLMEPIDVNCTSSKSFPAPELQWHIDGVKVTDRSILVEYGSKPAQFGLLDTTLGLRALGKPRMKLQCIAIIRTHRSERTVILEINSASKHQISAVMFLFVVISAIYSWHQY